MKSLRFYDVHFRARGDEHSRHEVPIADISEKEVVLLAKLHGGEAVLVKRALGEREVDLQQHYTELARKYHSSTMDGVEMVEKAFGIVLESAIEARMRNADRDPADSVVEQMQRVAQAASEERLETATEHTARGQVERVRVRTTRRGRKPANAAA